MKKQPLKKGDRVEATKMGYVRAGVKQRGTVAEDSYGERNYVRVLWDDGEVDFGFIEYFKHLRKI